MDFRNNPTLKVISIIVLAFFLWTFGGGFEIAYAAKNSSQHTVDSSQQTKKQKPEEKFQKAIEEIVQTVQKVQAVQTDKERENEKQKLKTKKTEIENLDVEIRKQFRETEEKIKDLPEEIKQRHRDFVKHYENNLKELNANLDAIDKAKTKEETDTAINKAKAHLEKVKPPKKHIPLDPNKLPHRTVEPVEVPLEEISAGGQKSSNVEDSSQYTVGSRQGRANRQKPILVASIGSLEGILSSTVVQASIQPTPDDLAENIEIQFTPEIQAKAEELQHNPEKIYNWVRNNIEFVPTYGSIQGANMCLQTKQCNDFDTASLLIALLRASNIPAKYVYGTIELPIEKVKNWVGGFTDSMEALRLLASAGIPTKGMTVGGEIKYVRIEHVWVESWVDYIPSRGARHKTGQGDTWISLDASFKQYNYTQGIDIKTAVPFDAQSFIDQIKSTATINEAEGYVTNVNSPYIQQTMTDYQTQVQNYITQNYPNATAGDVLGKKEIIKQEFPILAGTLPYKRITTGAKYADLPNSLRNRLTFEIYKDIYDEVLGTKIMVTKTLPELAGKRISLNYVPATETDKNLIDSYVQNYATSVPAYLIHLKAELKIDNTVVTTGPAITMGTDQILNLTFISPKGSETETHLMIAGDYNVIGLNLGGAKAIFEKRIAQNDFTDPISEMLYQTILGYWAEYDTLKDIYAKVYKITAVRLPSEGLSSAPVSIKYVFGTPYSGSYSGEGLDIKRDKEVVNTLKGDKEQSKRFNQYAGIIGSAFEGMIFDQLFGNNIGDAISTVRIIDLANVQGIPVYFINSHNINSILSNLQISGDAINDIKNAINAGKEVIVPKTNITHSGWTGIGYIIRDPNTGNGGYIISGGTAGGYSIKAHMSTAMPFAEKPLTSNIGLVIAAWASRVGPMAIAEASGAVEVAAGVSLGAAIASTAELLILAIIIVIITAYLIDTLTKEQIPHRWIIYRHYTTYCGLEAILFVGYINFSVGGCLYDAEI